MRLALISTRAAAERVYAQLFGDTRFEARNSAEWEKAAVLTKVFRAATIDRIEAAIRGKGDPWKGKH